MFVELKTDRGSITRRTVQTESEAATIAQGIAHRFNTGVTVFAIRKANGKKRFIRKVKPA